MTATSILASPARHIQPLSGKALYVLLLASFLTVAGCTPNQRIIESSRTPEPVAAQATPASTVESEIQAMQNADFTYILVFRRKDGAMMDAADKSFINANMALEVNRKTLSDGGRAVIIGSNFPFVPGTIEKLTDRFMMEDHSKPDAGPLEADPAGNTTTNSNRPRKADANAATKARSK